LVVIFTLLEMISTFISTILRSRNGHASQKHSPEHQ
jgi:hypothetical protein